MERRVRRQVDVLVFTIIGVISMPAGLEIQNGTASMFSVRETPWHREGHILTAAPSFDEAMALARLDYTVEKRPTFRQTDDHNFVQNARAFLTLRTDRGIELGSVGPDYTPLQNRDAFRALEPLLDEGICTLETGGVLRDGADAWLLAKIVTERVDSPLIREVFTDEILLHALLTNNHTGRRNATVAATPIRVVCANTLGLAEREMAQSGRYIGIRHAGNAAVRMVEAAETLFKGLVEQFEVVAAQYRVLKTCFLTDALFKKLILDPAIPDPRADRKFNPDAKRAELVIRRYETKASKVRALWTEGTGHTGDHSAWEAYNALVEAIDHDIDLFPTRAGVWRTASLMDGVLRQRKQAALNAVVAYAQSPHNSASR